MSRIKTLIVDDQELFASGLEIMLKGPGKDEFTVVGKARDGREAVSIVVSHRPDVVLMDVRMPVMDGVEATRIIHEKYPEVKILILTTFDDDKYVLDALNYGALGYVLKNITAEDLIASIKAVYRGNFSVSPSVGYKLVRRATEGARTDESADNRYNGEVNYLNFCFETLTFREAEILHHIMLDLDNNEIAERLFIAEQTVRNRISVIYSKLGVPDRTRAKRLVHKTLAANPEE